MQRTRPWHSVVTRLVACLILGGVLISIGLSVLELNRARTLLRLEMTQRVSLTARNLQSVLAGLVDRAQSQELEKALHVFTAGDPVQAIRLSGPELKTIRLGHWPDDAVLEHAAIWPINPHGVSTGRQLAVDQLTWVQAPFSSKAGNYRLELLVDGPRAWQQIRNRLFGRLAGAWLLLAVMTLLGLLLLRRWFTGPLSEVAGLIRRGANAQAFRRLARHQPGEFRQLAGSMADMLEHADQAAGELAKRERAFQSLYQFAPAAMVSLDSDGKITEANRRAAALFAVQNEAHLIGQDMLTLVREKDQQRLRQTIDRLVMQDASRCELSLASPDKSIRVAVEAAALRDEQGVMTSVRLSLLDISKSHQLQRELQDNSALMNSIINHMSDAILLVDAQSQVAAYNQQLANLLHRQPESLAGMTYQHETFWDALGVRNRELFVERLRQIEADRDRPAQHRVETLSGIFVFQGIPLCDVADGTAGRLWVVQEITSQEQSHRLLHQQCRQLTALKQVGRELAQAKTLDAVLVEAASQLFDLLDVDAVGLATRRLGRANHGMQMIHRGKQSCLLQPHQQLVAAVERELLPMVLPQQDVVFWSDLPARSRWGKAFEQAGLTSVAAGPLPGANDPVGMVWIARRGGERLQSHHIHLLETLIPSIAARIEVVELEQQLAGLDLADAGTMLAGWGRFELAFEQEMRVPDRPVSVVVFDLGSLAQLEVKFGEHEVDRLLRMVAGRVGLASRRSCILARIDKHTLGQIVPGLPMHKARAIADRLHEVIAADGLTLSNGKSITLPVSVGVATAPDQGQAVSQLCELARQNARAGHLSSRSVKSAG